VGIRKNVDFERVLQTAIALADEGGFESVTLASVANQLGIRIPSLYNHVAGLPALRTAMALWGVRELADRTRRAAVGKSGDTAIVSVADAYRAFALAHPGIYAATQRAAPADEPDLVAAQTEMVEIMIAVLAPYGLNEQDSLHAIRALRSAMHGFIDLETSGGFGMPLDRQVSFRRLIQLVIEGLHMAQANAHQVG
jgi:AcrR family transcriptional regulator